MDAKVLKAAVSAAIRVTVSTTLIGCGGSMTSNADAEGGKPGQSPTTNSAPKGSSDQVVTGNPKTGPVAVGMAGAPGAGGVATGGAAAGSAATTSGGAALAGMASAVEGGSAGEANGGAPQDTCAQIDACFSLLEASASPAVFGAPVTAANKPCCQTVLDGLGNWESSIVCLSELNERFMRSPARGVCCSQENWSYPACTPWGPPVPPELSREALLAWSAAA
jgi:hypothetical protein